jgi:superfamily II DNA or RNA helicase
MITFNITNNRNSISGPIKVLNALYKDLSIRHPGAWHLRRYMPKGWDGKMHYLTENGTFYAGMFQKIAAMAEKYDENIKVIDERDLSQINITKVKDLKGLVPRDYQRDAVEAIVTNKVAGVSYPRGIIKAATNAGKTIIAALLYERLGKPNTLLIINSTELYEQALKELPELINQDEIGFIEPNQIKWNKFMICKVKTTANRISESSIKRKLMEYSCVIVDECDLADNKTYKGILRNLVATPVKVGMSGTVFVSKLAKDKLKNENIRAFFGEQLYEITNLELTNKGHSSKVIATFFEGNTKIEEAGDFTLEYEKAIIKQKSRNTKVIDRVKENLKAKKYPILIACQYHPHVRILYRRINEELGSKYKVDWVHHKRKERAKVVEAFRVGNLDILIGSGILKRGKNFPHMYTLINAGAGLSTENILQILGRVFRKGRDNVKYYEDFFDQGFYLRKHSKRRVLAVKNEGLELVENYKKKTISKYESRKEKKK